jgi:outer membrane lipoprotein-sorting protein
MNKKRNTWLIAGGVIVLAALVSAFVAMQPSAKEILTQMLETSKTIENGHAVVNISVDSPEEKTSATVEVWGVHGEDGPGGFRLEVLETDKEEAVGAVIVSDGETVWTYSPAKNTVFTSTAEEAKAMMEEKQPMREEFDMEEFDRPENAEEAVDKLLEYFEAQRTGSDTVANSDVYTLELKPIPEQMPAEYTAVGGLVNLWIDKNRNVPLAAAYTGGSMGEVRVTALELEVNQGVDEALFTFEIPEGAEVMGFADMKPESITLDEAAASVDFEILTPDVLPDGATLVEVFDAKGMIVQQYALPEGGSFSISQGQTEEVKKPSSEEQAVEVWGVPGSLFVSDEYDKVLLSWTEGEMSFFVAGSITPEQALEIAESLK